MGLKRVNDQSSSTSGNPVPDASRTQIRWLIRRDMEEVLLIERAQL